MFGGAPYGARPFAAGPAQAASSPALSGGITIGGPSLGGALVVGEAGAPAGPVVTSLAVVRPVALALAAPRFVEITLAVILPVIITVDIEGDPAMPGETRKQGEQVQATLAITTPDGAAVTSATGVTVRAKPPTGSVRDYAVSAGAGAGQFVASVLLDLPGRWWLAAACSGPSPSVEEVPIDVTPRIV